MIESRCGLCCSSCTWREPCNCGGCMQTNGHPFYGECRVADCCQKRGYETCGECDKLPCEVMYDFSYLDPEHGDKPPGKRILQCRKWAAGKRAWKSVLLTSSGFEDEQGRQSPELVERFLNMLGKAPEKAKLLFIPEAARTEEEKYYVDKCYEELLHLGVLPQNIRVYRLDEGISAREALLYDAVYVTGGNTAHLLKRAGGTGFAGILKAMVYADKTYVGVSAGSLIATPNIGEPKDVLTAGLCLVTAFLSVHCKKGSAPRADLPLPHVPLADGEALHVRFDGYEKIGG